MPTLPKPHRAVTQRERETGWASRTAEHRKWYASAVWKRLREIVLRRDAGLCAVCGVVVGMGGHVDHIRPHKGQWSLFTDASNLQVLCGPCHSRKTMADESGMVQK
jgi:5-methylcytosine-specific restriction protein A